MGIVYFYYNKKSRQYFNMGKGFFWDEQEAIRKLFLSREKLEEQISLEIEHFSKDFDHKKYAGWLAEKLAGFKDSYGPIALGRPEDFQWFDDCSTESDLLHFCVKCNKYYCKCKNPDIPKCIGSRYLEDWDGDKFNEK